MKLGVGKLWSEFKAFAFQGNMIELAVAVIIGGAFGTVVTSLVNDVIMPSVIYTVHAATTTAEKLKDKTVETAKQTAAAVGVATTQASSEPTSQPATPLTTTTPPTATPVETQPTPAKPEAVHIDWKIGPVNMGAFLGALINFLLVAAAVFVMIVKLLGGVMKKVGPAEKPGEPTTRECPECLSIIPIKAKRCAHCTAVIAPPATM